MATRAATGQGTDGSTHQPFGATDRVWLNGTNRGDSITVGSYVEACRQDSNRARPHSARGYEVPAEYAQRAVTAAAVLPADDKLS